MDTGKNELPSQVHPVTEKEAKAHYKHMCNAGYDPLLCVHKKYIEARYDTSTQRVIESRIVDTYVHKDIVINEPRYVDLLKMGEVFNTQLDEFIHIPNPENILPLSGAIEMNIGVFWLRPVGCRTLTDLFKKYEAKIKILL